MKRVITCAVLTVITPMVCYQVFGVLSPAKAIAAILLMLYGVVALKAVQSVTRDTKGVE